jgi:hypothetical protein
MVKPPFLLPMAALVDLPVRQWNWQLLRESVGARRKQSVLGSPHGDLRA